jgi:DNA-directed RNA polymerase subunit RPC12/RpoP
MARTPVCIACGQATGPRARLNQLPDGRTCPSCRERILDELPPVLPSPYAELSLEEWAEEGEEPGEDYPKGA